MRRTPEQGHLEDHTEVVRIRAAAADLPGWRRWLVDRRCRRVFGSTWTDLAIDYPTNPEVSSDSVSAWLASAGRSPEQGADADFGLLHRAWCELPGHPTQDQLAGELRKLAACR